jgi:trans-2,3-dihydro-3-hydroxyanthranilate isomerase
MTKVNVKKVNAFTDSKKGGNGAGVVFNPPDLNPEQMSKVTRELNVSETAFLFPNDKVDFLVKFFTPTIEVDLCGHATIASYFLHGLENPDDKNKTITQKTNVGVLAVDQYFSDGMIEKVMMTQGKPVMENVSLVISEVADCLNISIEKIDRSLPIQKASTGLFCLPVCIKKFETLKNMKPDFKKVEKLCRKIDVGSIFVFSFETFEPESVYHGRCFCPVYGVNEDPVTGTANGAVCAYLVKNNIIKEGSFVCEQGDIIGRPGRVLVEVKDDVVKVGGRATVVEEMVLDV